MHLKYQQQIIKPNYTSTFFFYYFFWNSCHKDIRNTSPLSQKASLVQNSLETGREYPGKLSADPAFVFLQKCCSGSPGGWEELSLWFLSEFLYFLSWHHAAFCCYTAPFSAPLFIQCMWKENQFGGKTIKESIEQLLWRELLPAQHKKCWSSPS